MAKKMRFVLATEVKHYNETGNMKLLFVERGWAETDPKYRQIIPYVVLMDEAGRVGLFQRSKGTETRLQGLYTIGFGGHIDFKDVSDLVEDEYFAESALLRAVRREAQEELNFVPERIRNTYQVIESSDTEVDSVHFGMIYVAQTFLNEGNIQRYMDTLDHKELIFHGFKTFDEISALNSEEIESWSRKTLPLIR